MFIVLILSLFFLPGFRVDKVRVVSDVPGVGQNLQDHVAVYGLAWTIKPNAQSMNAAFSFPAVAQYVHHRKG